MQRAKSGVSLRFGDRVYVVSPDFTLVQEIEHELGGAAALREAFLQGKWKISDLVTLTHMMLQAAGKTVDYVSLGNRMVGEGLDRHLSPVRSFLQLALHSR